MRDDERSSRSPELQALLRDLDDLRLSLATDLSLAAAALEAGSPDIAGAVVDSDRAQLADFERRALQHLAEAAAPSPVDVPAVVPARRRRRSLLTAVTPLIATAAAVLGVLGGVVPTGGPQQEPSSGTQTAMASYQELTQLTLEGAEAAEVARAAERLHAELAAIVAQASSDPEAAQAALALLESETMVLGSSADRDQLSGVIAEARDLVARLRAALPALPSAPVRTLRLPSPTAAPDDVVVPAQAPSAPVLPVPPSAQPEPTPQPSPETTEPSEQPQPEQSASSSPDGSGGGAREGDPVLPQAVLPPD